MNTSSRHFDIFKGRTHELRLIRQKLEDRSKAQLIIVYGRRRVGKSTLIKKSIESENRILNFEGVQGESTPYQISRFLSDLSNQTRRIKLSAISWSDAFEGLAEVVRQGRWVIVIDELPWMAAGRTRMIAELKRFWDRIAQINPELVLFLCGSVASFMVKHVVHSKALHNRKTLEIGLNPLSPREAGAFLQGRSLFEKAQLYMFLGGIPKYLEQINPKESLEKNMNRLCFTSGGFFIDYLETLFKEQFKSIRTYQNIVELLARGPLTVTELAKKLRVSKGGGLQSFLTNLKLAQFVAEYVPYSPAQIPLTRTKQYKLVDPFLIFYFWYILKNIKIIRLNTRENLFSSLTSKNIHQFYGLAFERLCDAAFSDLLQKLDISLQEIETFGPFFKQQTSISGGLQIDNLVMRRDSTWMIFEYKYHQQPLGVEIIREVERKIKLLTKPRSISIERVLVAANGVTSNVIESQYFHSILTLEDLL